MQCEAMELFLFCVLSLMAQVSGESLMQMLSTNLELTTLYQYVNASSNLTSLFSSLDGVTFLAPSNAAFGSLLGSRNGTALSADELEELLQYHILDGNFTTKSFSTEPQFVPTFLKDPQYTNVTSGQVVELVSDGQGNPQIISWNKTLSTIITPVRIYTPRTLLFSASNNLKGPAMHKWGDPDRFRGPRSASCHGHFTAYRSIEVQLLCRWPVRSRNHEYGQF
jgi:hypothetical protein